MALLDFSTLEKDECVQWLQAMLTRPEMYAQNAGALEDQFCLLVALIWDSENGTRDFRRNYEDFRYRQKIPPQSTTAHYFEGDIKKTAAFLRKYLEEVQKE